jgi:hypothetical protein
MPHVGRLLAVFFIVLLSVSVPAWADEEYVATNISATTAEFRLSGGLYGIDAVATFSAGNITLQKLAGDSSTYVQAAAPITAAGYSTAYLPSGRYRLAITTATAVYVVINRIPVRNQ